MVGLFSACMSGMHVGLMWCECSQRRCEACGGMNAVVRSFGGTFWGSRVEFRDVYAGGQPCHGLLSASEFC